MIAWTETQRAEIDGVRTRYSHRPSPRSLEAPADLADLMSVALYQYAYWAIREMIRQMKGEREQQGLSIAEVSARSELPVNVLVCLEAGWLDNPSGEVVYRYGLAIEMIAER